MARTKTAKRATQRKRISVRPDTPPLLPSLPRKSVKVSKLTPCGLTKEQVAYKAARAGILIASAARIIHELNAHWWKSPKTGRWLRNRSFPEMIALAHSELSEALEGDRKDIMDDKLPHRPAVEVELADAVIRALDTVSGYHRTRRRRKLSIGAAVTEKLIFNSKRKDHSNAARLAKNGKAY